MSAHAFNLGRTLSQPLSVDFSERPKFELPWDTVRAIATEDGDLLICVVDRPARLQYATHEFARQWRRNGKDIPGATGKTYRKTGADIGCSITCYVTDARGVVSSPILVTA